MSAQGGHETALQSAGNRRKYRNRVPGFDLRIEILLVPDVVLIHEYIDKSNRFTFFPSSRIRSPNPRN